MFNPLHLFRDPAYNNFAYDIILVAGQSNADGYGNGDKPLKFIPHDPIYGYTEGKGIHLAHEQKHYHRGINAAFSLYFGEEYVKAGFLSPGRKLMILNTAVGGTGFSDHRWGLGEDLFERMIRMTREVLAFNPKNRIKAILWHQGETDVLAGMDGETYANNLRMLIGEIQKRLGIANVPFIAGNMVPGWMDQNPHSFEIADSTRDLMHSLPLGGYAESDGLIGNDNKEDIIHFSRASCVKFGKRYFNIYREKSAGQPT